LLTLVLLCFQIAIFSAISVASLANLQNLAGFQSSLANTPLNLTMSSTQHHSSSQPQQSTMPQLILASGQLVQGIQGAQLLIPTSQGTILFLFHPEIFKCDDCIFYFLQVWRHKPFWRFQ
jgi:hypothetical protein